MKDDYLDAEHEEEKEENEDQNAENGPKEPVIFKEKWKDSVYREKFLYSMFMTAAFISLGMCAGQNGPTFLDIQIITNTNLETASVFFTGAAAGFMVGALIAGVIYNKVNKPFLLFALTLSLGVTNIIIPYCVQFELMIFVRFINGAFSGALHTGINSEHMRQWGSGADGIMQFIHFGFAFGGVISPLFAEPFLAERGHYLPGSHNYTTKNESRGFNSSDQIILTSPKTNVHYVFLIIGLFVVLSSLPFFVTFCRHRNKQEKMVEEKRKFSQRNVPFPLLILMLVGVCFFYFIYVAVENTFFSYLMAFLVEEYDSVSKSKGAFTTSIAWAAFAVSRFLMIFLTKMFNPVQLILIVTTSMVVAYSCFTLFAYYIIIDGLVVFSAVIALSVSGVFPAGFSWMEREMFNVTAAISASILISTSIGGLVFPLILGYLMEEHSNMWFCYLSLIGTLLLWLIVFILLAFSRLYVDKRYGSLIASPSVLNQESVKAFPVDEINKPNSELEVKTILLH